ncbi:Helicase conserved C-terminal domain-containing protein [Lentzea xinjiangensis]|uniref:Helicase conserved C-terminal domain-containing protein n=1 Tax=Lentzea xinjiangensis TaxID=402600 RepID=A0A1H9GJ63_9PSEU|nr:helicase-associated domain-containing protein [Lentzea xinjiangensis]SEQ50135.1 Helicase conserved C-terminal domain-containing protein [Lentzea xinjiangensis]
MPRRINALATWLHQLEPDEVTAILVHRRDVADRFIRTLKDLATQLTDADSVRAAEDTLDQGALDVLGAIVAQGGSGTVDTVCAELRCTTAGFERAFAELGRRALAWPEGPRLVAVNSVRASGAATGRLTPRPQAPAKRTAPEISPVVPAMSTVDGVARLLAYCDQDNFDARYTGGVATVEIRRVARALRVADGVLRLWLELAAEAQLVGVDRSRLLPTRQGDDWLAARPGARLAALVNAWPRMDWRPEPDQARAALRDYTGSAGLVLRRSALESFSAHEAFLDMGELVAQLVWERPAVHDERATAAVIGEMESLGLMAGGALTPLGVAVRENGDVEAAAALLMPPATERALFQTDMTAVVTGLPSPELSATLDLVADLEDNDTARVWRLSAGSVRRALDTGLSAQDVLARLAAVAEAPLPQVVEHQVRDVARRHGQLTVTDVASCLRATDSALLQEIARSKRLAPLELRFLAPTVLASGKPMAETLAALRRAGYAPTGLDAGDQSIVESVERRRAPARGERRPESWWRTELDDLELTQLAVRLVEQERPTVGRGAPRAGAARMLRDQNVVLCDEEVLVLASALVDGQRVAIEYASGPRELESHVIIPTKHLEGVLSADCADGTSREFDIGHVRKVALPE